MLRPPPAPPLKVPISPDRDHVLGSMDAPIELVEYGDYQCPHCRKAVEVIAELRQRYGERLRFAYRHFPLAKMHPQARLAAEAAEAAAAQGKFWPMHDQLFQHQQALQPDQMLEYATAIGLDVEPIRAALNGRTYQARVQEDIAGGVRSGVNGTPTFFLNGFRHNGGYTLESFIAAIDALLAAAR